MHNKDRSILQLPVCSFNALGRYLQESENGKLLAQKENPLVSDGNLSPG